MYAPTKGQALRTWNWVKEHLADPAELWPDTFSPENTQQQSKIEAKPCNSFAKLVSVYESKLCWSRDLQNTLAAMLASVISTTIAGEQLWLRVIGPPSSGKSTLAEAISAAREYVKPLTTFTGVFSGWKTPGANSQDASPARKFRDKTVVIKDADSLFNTPGIEKILADLRDLYDKTSRVEYRNKVSIEEDNLQCTFILCGTDHIRGIDKSFLGERFLDCEVLSEALPKQKLLNHVITANIARVTGSIDGTENSIDHLEIKQFTAGYIQHLKQLLSPENKYQAPSVPLKVQQTILDLAELVALLRATVERSKDDTATYRPRPEIASRLVGQLIKLAICTAVVLNRPTVDDDCIQLVRKLACDTVNLRCYRFLILEAIYQEQETFKAGLTNRQISAKCNLSQTVTFRQTRDMQELHIIEYNSHRNASAAGGRNAHFWKINPEVKRILDATGVMKLNDRPEPRRKK